MTETIDIDKDVGELPDFNIKVNGKVHHFDGEDLVPLLSLLVADPEQKTSLSDFRSALGLQGANDFQTQYIVVSLVNALEPYKDELKKYAAAVRKMSGPLSRSPESSLPSQNDLPLESAEASPLPLGENSPDDILNSPDLPVG